MPAATVVLDHTALLALGAGNRAVCALVAQAHQEHGRCVYIPSMCLAAAVAARPALADHVAALPALEVLELDQGAATVVGDLIAEGVDWRAAHAIDASRATEEWPRGRPVVTALPGIYRGWDLATIPIS